MVKIVSLIPARGGSKRVPRKNIRLINNRPMIDYAIQASLYSKVDETYVSTEDREIRDISIECGARVIDRPKELALDNTPTESVIDHFTENVEYDVLVLIEPTYPLITKYDIDNSLDLFLSGNYDSFLTLSNKKLFLWETLDKGIARPVSYKPKTRLRTQDMRGVYVESGGIYIMKKEGYKKSGCRLYGDIGYYVLEHPSVDVDNEFDLKVAELILDIN